MGKTIFNQQDFVGASEKFFSVAAEMLSIYAEEWFAKPMIAYLEELVQRQHQEELEPIFCISLSILRTSLLDGQPGYRIDGYGQDWALYDQPLYTRFVDCSWLSSWWTELTAYFQGILDQQEIQKYTSPLQAEQAAWKCTGPLFSMTGSLLKYLVQSVKKSEAYKKLVKGNEFKIEFGEYLDWKIILMTEYPEVDLFNSRGRRFPHRNFREKVFHHKKFYRYDLKGTEFFECEFTDSTIEETTLNDCVFERCRFKNVILSNSFLAGAQFRECTMENVTFKNVVASFYGIPSEKVDDWYRPLYMLYSSMDHVKFLECDLREGQMEQCTTTYTTLENTQVEASDFAILMPNA